MHNLDDNSKTQQRGKYKERGDKNFPHITFHNLKLIRLTAFRYDKKVKYYISQELSNQSGMYTLNPASFAEQDIAIKAYPFKI